MPTQLSSLYTEKPFKKLFEALLSGHANPLQLFTSDDHYCCKTCTMKIACAYKHDFFSLYYILKGEKEAIHMYDVSRLSIEYDSDVLNIIYKIQRIHNERMKNSNLKQMPDSNRHSLDRLISYKQKREIIDDHPNNIILFKKMNTNQTIEKKLRKPICMTVNYIKAYVSNVVYKDFDKTLLHILSFDFDDVIDIFIKNYKIIYPELLNEILKIVTMKTKYDNILFLEVLNAFKNSLRHIDVMNEYCLTKQGIPEICKFHIEIKDKQLQLKRENNGKKIIKKL